MKTVLALAALTAFGAAAWMVSAQDAGASPDGNGPNGPAMRRHRPPPPLIIRAIDANHDGVIDATEIANASAALKSLDKNGDGQLTPDEFIGRPPRPRGQGGFGREGGGPDGNLYRPPAGGATGNAQPGVPPDNAPAGPAPDGQ